MKKFKEKLEKEFWDFVALVTLFFVSAIIFSFAKIAILAIMCWIMFLFFAFIFPVKWIIQFLLSYLKEKAGK